MSSPFTTGQEISRLMPGYGPEATTRYGHTQLPTSPRMAPISSRPMPATTGCSRPRRPNDADDAGHALDEQLAAAVVDQLNREFEEELNHHCARRRRYFTSLIGVPWRTGDT